MSDESKVYVKLKDTGGSFYIPSQGVSINRNRIVQVEEDAQVIEAINKGGLLRCKKSEYDKYWADHKVAETQVAETIEKAKVAEKTEFGQDEAQALLNRAVDKGKATIETEGEEKNVTKVLIGQKPFETIDEVLTYLVTNEKARKALQKSVQ